MLPSQLSQQPQSTTTPTSRHNTTTNFLPFAPINPSPLSPSPSFRITGFGGPENSQTNSRADFLFSSPTPASRVSSSPVTPVHSSPFMSRNDENQRPTIFQHSQNGYGNVKGDDEAVNANHAQNTTPTSTRTFNFDFQPQPQSQSQPHQHLQQQQQSPSSPQTSPFRPSTSPFSRRATPSGTAHILSSRGDLSTRRSAFLNRVRQSRSDARYSARHDSITRMEYLSWIEDRRKEIESLKRLAPDLSSVHEELEREEEEVRKLVDWEQGLIEELERSEEIVQDVPDEGFDGDGEYDEIFEDLVRTGEVSRLESEMHGAQGHEDHMDIDMD